LESLAAANRHAAEQASVVIRIARQLRPAEPVADVSQRQRRSPAPSSNPASPLSNPPRLAPAIPATAGVAAPGFEPEPPAASAVATPKSTSREPISAELEVERFGWPEFMETWDDATWKQIDAVAEVIRATAASGRNVLGVASETTGAGSTTVLLAAARRLASAERRIVLVDADRHRPQLAVQLGISPQIGWIDIAAGDRRLAEAIIKSGDDRLMLLPLCGADRAAPHDAAGEKLAEYLGLLRDDFEIVLVDLGAGGESPILGDSSEAGPVLFVRSELGCLPGQPTSNSKPGCLPGEATSNGARGLGNDRVPKGTIGIVENFAEVDATNVPRSPSVPRNTPSEFCCQIDEAGRHAAA
jgi:Mrp family chromosome partitioning ATPase